MNDIHEKFLEVITYDFDFHKKRATNSEDLHAIAAKMTTYVIARQLACACRLCKH